MNDTIDRLPHAGVARFVRRIVAQRDDEITCEGEVPAKSPLAEGDRVRAVVTLELAAQAAALLEIVSGITTARSGYLVRVRDVQASRAWTPAGRPLRVVVRRAGAAPPLHLYEVQVEDGDGELLTATIGTWLA